MAPTSPAVKRSSQRFRVMARFPKRFLFPSPPVLRGRGVECGGQSPHAGSPLAGPLPAPPTLQPLSPGVRGRGEFSARLEPEVERHMRLEIPRLWPRDGGAGGDAEARISPENKIYAPDQADVIGEV